MTDRPYFNSGIEQLEAVSASMWNDADGLVTLSVELGHRATQRASDLRARVIRRIFELEHGIAPTHRAQAAKLDDGRTKGKQDPPSQQSTSTHHDVASEPPERRADSQGPVGRAISDVRRKLLDLTGRSRLLNYRFTKRSLRVVGELPNLLFERLTDGQSMMFIPIPEPPRRWDETQDAELSATTESPNADDRQQSESRSQPDGKRKSTWGNKKKRKRHLPPVEQEAQRLGISTEYDLPLTATPTGELDRASADVLAPITNANYVVQRNAAGVLTLFRFGTDGNGVRYADLPHWQRPATNTCATR